MGAPLRALGAICMGFRDDHCLFTPFWGDHRHPVGAASETMRFISESPVPARLRPARRVDLTALPGRLRLTWMLRHHRLRGRTPLQLVRPRRLCEHGVVTFVPALASANTAIARSNNLPGYGVVEAVDLPLGGRRVKVQPVDVDHGCPVCGVVSSRVHAWVEQRMRDIPYVEEIYHGYDGCRIRAFIPLLVERASRDRLRSLPPRLVNADTHVQVRASFAGTAPAPVAHPDCRSSGRLRLT